MITQTMSHLLGLPQCVASIHCRVITSALAHNESYQNRESYELASTGVGKRWIWGKQGNTGITQLVGQNSE